eukprot:TRINITY_DN8053_c0_g1_i1.p1 TRINITY_DN8053_c0_g1~~TRINITY_DN8053_c0_g1_i1.p1  ORF type:complete len:422 (+),score=61.76 TRINITY_DN8053_c0_g1_i1:142-1407(+)
MTVSLANMSQQNVMSPWVFLQCDGNTLTAPRAFHTAVGWDGKMWVWGGMVENVEEANRFSIFNFKENTWSVLTYTQTNTTPPPLHGHTAVVHDNLLYIFGGITDIGLPSNTLYQYSFELNEWAAFNSNLSPPARAHHCMELSSHLGGFIVYGGEGTNGTILSDLWLFHLSNHEWVPVTQLVRQNIEEKPHGLPSPRRSASLICNEDRAYLYGGTDGKTTFGGNCHILHFTNYHQTGCMEWEAHLSDSFPPAERWGHTLNKFGLRMYLFGGKDGSGGKYVVLNDWHRFSFKYQIWVRLSPSGHVPRPRWGHSTCIIDKHLLVFGGMSDKGTLNDMYQITLGNSTSILATLSEKRLIGNRPLTSERMLSVEPFNDDEPPRMRERKRLAEDTEGCFSIAHHLKSTRFFSNEVSPGDQRYSFVKE